MSYTPTTDFLALLRQTSGGIRTERMPGLDYFVAVMARAGLFAVQVGQTAPTVDQASTVWFRPASPSWAAEGAIFLFDVNTGQYELASPALWSVLLASAVATAQVIQDVTTPGPADVLAYAGIVRVNQVISAPITLVMPLSASKIGGVLISDWKGDAGANNIRVNLSGTDVFPGAATFWTIAADTGSIFLRPVPGGYVL